MDPDHHGQSFRRGTCRGPHVEEKTILTYRLLRADTGRRCLALPCGGRSAAGGGCCLIVRCAPTAATTLPACGACSCGACSCRTTSAAALHTASAVLVGRANAFPFGDWLR